MDSIDITCLFNYSANSNFWNSQWVLYRFWNCTVCVNIVPLLFCYQVFIKVVTTERRINSIWSTIPTSKTRRYLIIKENIYSLKILFQFNENSPSKSVPNTKSTTNANNLVDISNENTQNELLLLKWQSNFFFAILFSKLFFFTTSNLLKCPFNSVDITRLKICQQNVTIFHLRNPFVLTFNFSYCVRILFHHIS